MGIPPALIRALAPRSALRHATIQRHVHVNQEPACEHVIYSADDWMLMHHQRSATIIARLRVLRPQAQATLLKLGYTPNNVLRFILDAHGAVIHPDSLSPQLRPHAYLELTAGGLVSRTCDPLSSLQRELPGFTLDQDKRILEWRGRASDLNTDATRPLRQAAQEPEAQLHIKLSLGDMNTAGARHLSGGVTVSVYGGTVHAPLTGAELLTGEILNSGSTRRILAAALTPAPSYVNSPWNAQLPSAATLAFLNVIRTKPDAASPQVAFPRWSVEAFVTSPKHNTLSFEQALERLQTQPHEHVRASLQAFPELSHHVQLDKADVFITATVVASNIWKWDQQFGAYLSGHHNNLRPEATKLLVIPRLPLRLNPHVHKERTGLMLCSSTMISVLDQEGGNLFNTTVAGHCVRPVFLGQHVRLHPRSPLLSSSLRRALRQFAQLTATPEGPVYVAQESSSRSLRSDTAHEESITALYFTALLDPLLPEGAPVAFQRAELSHQGLHFLRPDGHEQQIPFSDL